MQADYTPQDLYAAIAQIQGFQPQVTDPNPAGNGPGTGPGPVPGAPATTSGDPLAGLDPALVALFGGKDNFTPGSSDYHAPPQWMIDMVKNVLAMPDGPDKQAAIDHIINHGNPNRPQWDTDYLKQMLLGAPGPNVA